MKLQDMVNHFLTASAEEQATFLKLVRGIKRGSAKEQQDNAGVERRLYEAVRAQMLSLLGVRLPAFEVLCKGTDARVKLESAVRWLCFNPLHIKMTRPVEQALFGLAADAVAHDWKAQGMRTQPTKEETVRLLASVPRATDRAFPMYRSNGLLLRIAQKASRGELPLVRDEEEEVSWTQAG